MRPTGATGSGPHSGVSALVWRHQQGARISKFSGNKGDWARWKMEWMNYIKVLTMGGGEDEQGMQLALIENVDETTGQLL